MGPKESMGISFSGSSTPLNRPCAAGRRRSGHVKRGGRARPTGRKARSETGRACVSSAVKTRPSSGQSTVGGGPPRPVRPRGRQRAAPADLGGQSRPTSRATNLGTGGTGASSTSSDSRDSADFGASRFARFGCVGRLAIRAIRLCWAPHDSRDSAVLGASRLARFGCFEQPWSLVPRTGSFGPAGRGEPCCGRGCRLPRTLGLT
jgi:hypothetical protein